MISAILGQKNQQSQKFQNDGTRIPVTEITVGDNPVVCIKTKDKDGYWAVQIGFGIKKNPSKPLLGHIKGAKLENAPLFLREISVLSVKEEELPKVGDLIKPEEVFKPGDLIEVTGVSKGKGFAGGVKRYHFKGGPRTHGQSDRERAPGSIGQTTTPGRVYRGKRMAGKMGNDTVTIKNLQIVGIGNGKLVIKGVVPGTKGSLLTIKKTGESKKYVPVIGAENMKAEEAAK